MENGTLLKGRSIVATFTEHTERLKTLGYIDNVEATRIMEMPDSGTFPQRLQELGCSPIQVPLAGKSGRVRRMWLKSEVEAAAAKLNDRDSLPVGGEQNGGKLMHEIRLLKQRVAELEAWRKEWTE
jgi:hypothetical protein